MPAESPVTELVHEHSVIGIVVVAMEREADRIRATGTANATDVRKMVEFTRRFTDGCHHAKEEELLFPRLLELTEEARAPIAVLLKEHAAGRARITAVEAAVEAVNGGDQQAQRRLRENLRGYAALLTAHIAKENNVLFPLAERTFSDTDRRQLIAGFERIEEERVGEGEHERLRGIAEELSSA